MGLPLPVHHHVDAAAFGELLAHDLNLRTAEGLAPHALGKKQKTLGDNFHFQRFDELQQFGLILRHFEQIGHGEPHQRMHRAFDETLDVLPLLLFQREYFGAGLGHDLHDFLTRRIHRLMLLGIHAEILFLLHGMAVDDGDQIDPLRGGLHDELLFPGDGFHLP